MTRGQTRRTPPKTRARAVDNPTPGKTRSSATRGKQQRVEEAIKSVCKRCTAAKGHPVARHGSSGCPTKRNDEEAAVTSKKQLQDEISIKAKALSRRRRQNDGESDIDGSPKSPKSSSKAPDDMDVDEHPPSDPPKSSAAESLSPSPLRQSRSSSRRAPSPARSRKSRSRSRSRQSCSPSRRAPSPPRSRKSRSRSRSRQSRSPSRRAPLPDQPKSPDQPKLLRMTELTDRLHRVYVASRGDKTTGPIEIRAEVERLKKAGLVDIDTTLKKPAQVAHGWKSNALGGSFQPGFTSHYQNRAIRVCKEWEQIAGRADMSKRVKPGLSSAFAAMEKLVDWCPGWAFIAFAQREGHETLWTWHSDSVENEKPDLPQKMRDTFLELLGDARKARAQEVDTLVTRLEREHAKSQEQTRALQAELEATRKVAAQAQQQAAAAEKLAQEYKAKMASL